MSQSSNNNSNKNTLIPTRNQLRQMAAQNVVNKQMQSNLSSEQDSQPSIIYNAADKIESERLKGMKLDEVRQEYQRLLGVKPNHKANKDQLIKMCVQTRRQVSV